MPSRMRMAGVAALAVSLSIGFSGLAVDARAEESPATAAEATRIVERLRAEQAELDKQYNEASAKAQEIGDRADAQRAQVDATARKVESLKGQLGAVALASYQGRGNETAFGLLTSSDANFLNRVGTADQFAANQTATLQEFQTEQANLTDLQRSLSANEAAAQKELARVKELDEAARAKVVEAQKVADKLTAEEKAKFEAEQAAKAKAEAEARAAAAAAGQRQASTAQERIAAPAAPAATAARVATTAAPAPTAAPTTAAPAPAVAPAPVAPAPAPSVAPAPAPVAPVPSSPILSVQANRYSWGSCVWWAYERRAAMGRPVGANWGNANQWPGNASAAGFSVGGSPQVGDVLIQFYAGPGHAAVVESVTATSITISEMNWNGGIGVLHYRTLSLPAWGTYIH